MQDICFYNLHLPDEVRLIHIPPECIRLWNEKVIIYDLKVHDLIVRHFSFYDRWLGISFFLNKEGEIESLPGDIPIGFICDITSPQFSYGTEIYNVDLAFDILITPDGSNYKLIDEDNYQEYKSKGYMSLYEAEKAHYAYNEFIDFLQTNSIHKFMENIFPDYRRELNFDIQSLSTSNLLLSQVPKLAKSGRDRQFGKKIP